MNYRNILPLVSHTQAFSTDYWNDFGYWNDGTFWYEKTPTYTARVTAYANATGITDYTILDPLNIFDLGLTYYGLDTIMKAIYPMVTDKTSQSDMATQMKYNFMNPLDTSAAFRLQWFGGWIYSRTGALPNGTNAYGDTNIVSSSVLTLNSTHISFYSRTNSIGSNMFGVSNSSQGFILQGAIYGNNAAQSNFDCYNASLGRILGSTVADSRGFGVFTRSASNSSKIFWNNSQVGYITTTGGGLPSTFNLVFSARNSNGTIDNFNNKECAFASIGNGLTDFQADIFSTLVNNLQKALNRAVY